MSKEGESCSQTLWAGRGVEGALRKAGSMGWGGRDSKGPGVRPGWTPTFMTYLIYDFGQAPSPLSVSPCEEMGRAVSLPQGAFED